MQGSDFPRFPGIRGEYRKEGGEYRKERGRIQEGGGGDVPPLKIY